MAEPGNASINWEAFYGSFRKPGYIAGFEILEKLGAGVFGLVYKARKESIGKLYAIKFLKVDDESVREAVVRELDSVRYFAQVDHPNLVAIEDKGEVDGIPYILMAYAGDSTLRRLLDSETISRDDALRIFVQISRGLQALHDRSLVHFDLKPANIYLKGDVARIGDYGLSKLVSQTRNSLSFGRGTPHYMAPEMLSRHGDHRSDIYSLGILLYEMLVGKTPFTGDSEWQVLRKHESEEPDYPASLDSGDRRVIERCLAKDPEQRFQSIGEVLSQLEGAAQVAPAHASTVAPRRRNAPTTTPKGRRATHSERTVDNYRSPAGRMLAICLGIVIAFMAFRILASTWKRTRIDPLVGTASEIAGAPQIGRVEASSSRSVPSLLAFPKDTGYRRQKDVERIVLKLRRASVKLERKLRTSMRKIGECAAVPALVNQMAQLNLYSVDDANFAFRINETLRDLTSHNIKFAKPRSKRRVDSKSAKRNARAIKLWANYYRSQHTDKPSSRSTWGR